jgi:alpha-1,2-mannosyltransferase
MSNSVLRPAPDVRGRRWFVLALLLVFVGVSVAYSLKALHGRSAIQRWQAQIVSSVDAGVDISERYQYPNPPVMAVLLYPLVKLQPPLAAALVWYYVKVVFALLSLFWVFRLIAPEDRPFPAWAQGLAVLLSLRPVLSDLQHGNVNLFILFLIVAALTAYRRGFDLFAGIVLALSVACKVTPALFVPYFVWKRAWKMLAGTIFGLALFLWPGFVPALFLGWDENRHQLTSWYKEMVHPFVVEGKVWTEQNNQSLPGLAYRMLTDSPSVSHYEENVYKVDERANVVTWDPGAVRWLLKGYMGVFALVVVWCCRTPTRPRQGWRLAAEFALVVLGMLLFSERTWKHHCVTLMLPFGVLCYYLGACNPAPGPRALLIGTLVVSTLLIEATSTSLVGMEFGKAAQTYGAFVWAHLLLAGALVVLLWQPAGERPLDATAPDLKAIRQVYVHKSETPALSP